MDIEKYTNKRRNRSTLYLFPLIYDEINITSSNVTNEENGFKMINLYIKDQQKNEYNNCILMLIKILDYDNPNFKLFLSNLKNNIFFKEYYNVETHYIMIVFEMREEDKDIINNFIRGRYSNFPLFYREFFPKNMNTSIKCQYNVLTKNNLLKHKIEQDLGITLSTDAELDDRPYLEEEIFRYE